MTRAGLPRLILIFCLFLSFVRGTNIGLFYPADEFQLGMIDYTFQTVSNFILLLGTGAYFFLGNDYRFLKEKGSKASWLIPVILALISFAFSTDHMESLKFLLAIAVVTLPSLLFLREFGARRLLAALSLFTVGMAFVNLAYVFVFPEYAIMIGHHAGRWKGMFEHKNMAAAFFAAGFYIILAQVNRRAIFKFIAELAAMIICLVFVYKGQSSTAWVMLLLTGFCLFFFNVIYRLVRPAERIAVLLVTVFAFMAVLTFAGHIIMDEFFVLTGKDATLTGRTGIWNVIFDFVSAHPLVGYGPGMSERPDFMERIQGAVGWAAKGTHNSFLDMLLSFGYPLTILFTLLIVKIWFSSFFLNLKNRSSLEVIVLASTLIISIFAFSFAASGAMLSRTIFWLMLAIGVAILADYSNKQKQSGEAL